MTVGYGLAKLHHVFSRRAREKLLLGALHAGCSHFDVAPTYGDGLAEAETGRVLSRYRDRITLGTKFGIPCAGWGERSEAVYYARKALAKLLLPRYGLPFSRRDFGPEAAVTSLEESLRRLRTDYVDFLFLHEPRSLDELHRLAEIATTLETQKRAGKLRHYGIAAPTRFFRDTYLNEEPFGDSIQFEVSAQSQELLNNLTRPSNMFGYGLIRHLRPNHSTPRLEIGDVLRWFISSLPGVVPLISTNRTNELERLGRAIAALG